MSLVSESINSFIRGKDPKDLLDVGEYRWISAKEMDLSDLEDGYYLGVDNDGDYVVLGVTNYTINRTSYYTTAEEALSAKTSIKGWMDKGNPLINGWIKKIKKIDPLKYRNK